MRREIASLSDHFAEAPEIFTTSPLYRSLCAVVATDVPTLELLTLRRHGQQPSFLLFGAIHYLLLAGAAHPLREFYPSVVGEAARDPAEAGPALLDFRRVYADQLASLIRTRLVQTNVPRRVVALRFALAAIARDCAGPVHLIEVGASAGLLLLVDRYRYLIGEHAYGPAEARVTVDSEWRGTGPPPNLDDIPPIASRTGVDLRPVDITDVDQRRWLRALVWPEDRGEARLLAAALDAMAADPPTIIAGNAIDVCPTLGRTLPAGEPRLVFHAATRMHVPTEQRIAFDEAIDTIGEHGPLFHAWLEPPTALHHGYPAHAPHIIALHGPGNGHLHPVARADGHLHWVEPPT